MTTTAAAPVPAVLDRGAIALLVQRFYDAVRADDVLGPTFDAVLHGRWESHLPRMVEFWSTLMLGARSFSGNVFGAHMAVPGVGPQHFERWLALWAAQTQALCAPEDAAQLQVVAQGIARNLYRGYFGDAVEAMPAALRAPAI